MNHMKLMLLTGALCSSAFVTQAAAADYRATALAMDPVVYFSLDDTLLSQPAINLAGGASSAGAGGNADYDLAGPELGLAGLIPGGNGTAARFGNNTLRTPLGINTAGSTGYTIAFWLRAPSNPSGPINLVGDGESALGFYAMVYLLSDGKVRAHAKVAGSFTSVDTNASVTDGEVHHIVARFSQPPLAADALLEVFVDGAARASLTTSRNNLGSYLARLSMGRDLREPGSALITLDEVAAWDRSLNAAEIALLTGSIYEDSFE